MIKIRVRREQILATSGGRENESIKSFKDSEIKENKVFRYNHKTGVITSGKLKIGQMLYNQKCGKITAQFRILDISV